MMRTSSLLLLCLAVAVCAATRRQHFASKQTSAMRLRNLIGKGPMQWKDCSKGTSQIKIRSLNILPSTLTFPGPITFSFDVNVPSPVTGPVKAEYSLHKKVAATFLPIPCSAIGGCKVKDVCTLMPKKCPAFFARHNLSCHCPLAAGNYKLSPVTMQLPKIPKVPSVADGDFRFEVKLTNAAKEELLCFEGWVGLEFHEKKKKASLQSMRKNFLLKKRLMQFLRRQAGRVL